MRERRRVASWGNLDVAAGGDETSGGGPNNIELEFIERTSPRARDLAAARSAAAAAAAEAERGRQDAFTATAATLGAAASAGGTRRGARGDEDGDDEDDEYVR